MGNKSILFTCISIKKWITVILNCVIFNAVLNCPASFAGTIVVKGSGIMEYELHDETGKIQLPNYSSEFYRQTVIKVGDKWTKIHVSIQLPSESLTSKFPINIHKLLPTLKRFLRPVSTAQSNNVQIRRLATALTANTHTVQESVDKIIGFVRDNIKYVNTINDNNDALYTIKKKRGNCVGYSNATIALLRAAGIPCRSVHGFLYREETQFFDEKIEKLLFRTGNFHRWIEIYYPGIGWIQSDPIISKNFVHPDHIIFHINFNEQTELSFTPFYQTVDLKDLLRLSVKKIQLQELNVYPYPQQLLYSIICKAGTDMTNANIKEINSKFLDFRHKRSR
ncbi:MAG: hypothetical protein A2161_16800 [Candidatus Schekmanbacteria bacterium RBG_13_48_7]|uniref:Transglutaminase-like domain-containing protein n=1 Tax=Candidatus Schekmanbacteria bacterium RBG_13_48_7 TaxID=1817878 RepID=A0A1F7RJC7_9BACT|nr:MAG: hypothetical protein A2161_16800 [Candidatus Schekmanbacteria bacterium RBG_13_48_7]